HRLAVVIGEVERDDGGELRQLAQDDVVRRAAPRAGAVVGAPLAARLAADRFGRDAEVGRAIAAQEAQTRRYSERSALAGGNDDVHAMLPLGERGGGGRGGGGGGGLGGH